MTSLIRWFAAAAWLAAIGIFTGCQDKASALPGAAVLTVADPVEPGAALPMPTKDEVALVDGRPFPISSYLALRIRLKSRGTEAALWAGMATLAIQNSTRARGRELDSSSALSVALFALGESDLSESREGIETLFQRQAALPSADQVRRELDALLGASIVRRNERLLASLGPH